MSDHESDLTEPGSNSPDPGPSPSAGAPEPALAQAAWVGAAGVSGEHVIAGERAPRLHWALMILGPVGLAAAILSSLWSSSRQVERSVNVQVETQWAPGEQLAARTHLVDGSFEAIEPAATVSLAVLAGGERHELAELDPVAPGFAQGRFEVPEELAPGEAELLVHFEPAPGSDLEPFDERLAITIVGEREAGAGRQVVSEHMLQWADDTDEQPEGVRIDLRPDGRLLAGFDNTMFLRVTDPAGKPWTPAGAAPPAAPDSAPATDPATDTAPPAHVQVRLISGEFAGKIGTTDDPPVVYEGPLDALGLARFSGELASDVVRFEVRLPTPTPAPALAPSPEAPPDVPAPAAAPAEAPPEFGGPKRRLRFVSHAGTVRVHASTDLARPGEPVRVVVQAISARKPIYVDTHGPTGAWLDTFTPPLTAGQEREWTIPFAIHERAKTRKTGTLVQFEAYQSTLRPEDSSALARVQVVGTDSTPAEWIAALVEGQRAQLDLPRVDKQFEIGRERAYLSHIEAWIDAESAAGRLDDEAVARTRAFLLGSLEAVVHGPPQALNTRAREDEDLAEFKRRWTIGVRWFLLGGGSLFILVMSALVWRNQRQLEISTTAALAAGSPGDPLISDEEVLADQSLSLQRSRRELLARGLFTVALMIAALALTVAMLEALVWDY